MYIFWITTVTLARWPPFSARFCATKSWNNYKVIQTFVFLKDMQLYPGNVQLRYQSKLHHHCPYFIKARLSPVGNEREIESNPYPGNKLVYHSLRYYDWGMYVGNEECSWQWTHSLRGLSRSGVPPFISIN